MGAERAAADGAAHHVGLAWALSGLLRAVPFHAHHKRVYLPQDLIDQTGLKLGDLFELRPSDALCRAAERLYARAHEHLRNARAARRAVPKPARAPLLLAALARRDLQVLRAAAFDPFHPSVQARGPGRIWRLAWAHVRGAY